jgi:leader peptidase (prepilin peptidase) / N-methyltransferase
MPIYIQPDLYALVVTGLLGLIVGSFLNVVVARLPVMQEREWFDECVNFLRELAARQNPQAKPETQVAASLASLLPAEDAPRTAKFNLMVPRSRCPHCEHAIGALENIPVISYLCLRGRCKGCQTQISIRYPLVELFTAALSVLIVLQLGAGLAGIAGLGFTWALIAAAFIDADTQYLPDDITYPLLWAGLLVNLFGVFTTLPDAVIGAAAGYLSLWSVYWIFKLLTGKEGMGYGDFKLLAALGAWLGWQQLIVVVLLSSVVGAIVGIALMVFHGRGRGHAIPFGPYLAMAGWLALIWGHDIATLYLRTAGMGPPH